MGLSAERRFLMRPLFILCPGRSFSSVVCAAIGQHPDLCGLPELNLALADDVEGIYTIARQKRKKHMLHGLYRVIAQIHRGEQTEFSVKEARNWLKRRRSWKTIVMYHYLAEQLAPRNLVDKTPGYSSQIEHLQRLHRMFPEARYLHLSRHPRPTTQSLYQVHSQKALKKPESYSPRALADIESTVERHWLNSHQNILQFSEALSDSQYLRLRGEDLLAEPTRYFRQIAEWLAIRTDEAAISEMLHPERSPYACVGPQGAHSGNNPGFLKDPKLRQGPPKPASLEGALEWSQAGRMLSEASRSMARRLGYR